MRYYHKETLKCGLEAVGLGLHLKEWEKNVSIHITGDARVFNNDFFSKSVLHADSFKFLIMSTSVFGFKSEAQVDIDRLKGKDLVSKWITDDCMLHPVGCNQDHVWASLG